MENIGSFQQAQNLDSSSRVLKLTSNHFFYLIDADVEVSPCLAGAEGWKAGCPGCPQYWTLHAGTNHTERPPADQN
jgi:hypothetical protein